MPTTPPRAPGPRARRPPDDVPEPRSRPRGRASPPRIGVFVGCGVATLVAALVLLLRPGCSTTTPAGSRRAASTPGRPTGCSRVGPELAARSADAGAVAVLVRGRGGRQIEVDPNAPRQVNAFLVAARDAGAAIVPSVVDALAPARWPRCWPIRRSGPGMPRPSPSSRPAATSQGWTSTTKSSPSPTTARPGPPRVRAGWRSSRSWPNSSTPTGARSPSASRPCTTTAGRRTAATGSTTTRPSPRSSTGSG